MNDNPWKAPPFPPGTLELFAAMLDGGGTLRMGPLLGSWDGVYSREELCAAIGELLDRGWIRVRFQPPRDRQDGRLADIERLTVTRQGRFLYRTCWSARKGRRQPSRRAVEGRRRRRAGLF